MKFVIVTDQSYPFDFDDEQHIAGIYSAEGWEKEKEYLATHINTEEKEFYKDMLESCESHDLKYSWVDLWQYGWVDLWLKYNNFRVKEIEGNSVHLCDEDGNID